MDIEWVQLTRTKDASRLATVPNAFPETMLRM